MINYTKQDIIDSVNYGFKYALESQNDGKEVPEGNILQWLIGVKNYSYNEVMEIEDTIKISLYNTALIKIIKGHYEKYGNSEDLLNKIFNKIYGIGKYLNVSIISKMSYLRNVYHDVNRMANATQIEEIILSNCYKSNRDSNFDRYDYYKILVADLIIYKNGLKVIDLDLDEEEESKIIKILNGK